MLLQNFEYSVKNDSLIENIIKWKSWVFWKMIFCFISFFSASILLCCKNQMMNEQFFQRALMSGWFKGNVIHVLPFSCIKLINNNLRVNLERDFWTLIDRWKPLDIMENFTKSLWQVNVEEHHVRPYWWSDPFGIFLDDVFSNKNNNSEYSDREFSVDRESLNITVVCLLTLSIVVNKLKFPQSFFCHYGRSVERVIGISFF